jgi:hypothetical protein
MKGINAPSLIKAVLFLVIALLCYFHYYVQTASKKMPNTEEVKAILEEASKNLQSNEGVSLGYAIVVGSFNPPEDQSPDPDNMRIELLSTFLSLISAAAIIAQARRGCFIPIRGKPQALETNVTMVLGTP